jgi:pyridoxal phosphate enzyme (YggS family)
MPVTKAKIEKNLRLIRANIELACAKANRRPEEVSIVAVTKSVEVETVKAVLELGLTDLGESRVQQLVPRAEELRGYLERRRDDLPGGARWHMVGHLQRNKVKLALDYAQVIHSVDSLRLAEEINLRAQQLGRSVDVFLQVNCSQEEQKFGVAVGAATHMGEMIGTLRNLRLVGLMTMAPLVADPEQARAAFIRLRELFEEMRGEKTGGDAFRHLSMGMSNDYMVAVEEGATVLRIGTALFA